MMISLNNYAIVDFDVRIFGKKIKTKGYLINDWLAAGWNAKQDKTKIYNKYGYPVADIEFETWQDAISFGIWFEKIYHDFFLLWEDYPDANLPLLCQWTLDNGTKFLEQINDKTLVI